MRKDTPSRLLHGFIRTSNKNTNEIIVDWIVRIIGIVFGATLMWYIFHL